MEDYTLRISEKNSKALALLNYLKTLDFIELTKKSKSTDWWDELSENHKKAIKKGMKQADKGKLISKEEARKRVDTFFQHNG